MMTNKNLNKISNKIGMNKKIKRSKIRTTK